MSSFSNKCLERLTFINEECDQDISCHDNNDTDNKVKEVNILERKKTEARVTMMESIRKDGIIRMTTRKAS